MFAPRLILPVLLVQFGLSPLSPATGKAAPATLPEGERSQSSEAPSQFLAKAGLIFEKNKGQADPVVQFSGKGRGYSVFLTKQEAVLVFSAPSGFPVPSAAKNRRMTPPGGEPLVLRLQLSGASPDLLMAGADAKTARVNYYLGSNAENQLTNLETYGRVEYHRVYKGIDLVFYGTEEGKIQYDFRVAPNGDYRSIRLKFGGHLEGGSRIKVDGAGNLILAMRDGAQLQWNKPFAYQEQEGRRQEVAAKYHVRGDGQIAFALGFFDSQRPLVIDPVLSYSTYLGGTGTDEATAVAMDGAGNAWVTGYTGSTNFPTAGSPYQPNNRNNDNSPDVFVSKFNASGTLLYSTYFGGTSDDLGFGIAVDGSGNPWITGRTRSTDLPMTGGPAQGSNAGGVDAFVAKFGATGNLLYSSYLGGSGNDEAAAIAVDGSGAAWITGDTASTNFRTAGNPARPATGGAMDAFASKFSATGQLLYSTYLGGAADDLGFGIATDSSGSAWVTGVALSNNFPLAGAPAQAANAGLADAFLAKFASNGSLAYSSYLGGVNNDNGFAIAVDAQGNAWIAGDTGSPNFPTTSGAYQTSYGGFEDAFVAKCGTNGALLYSTYCGGSGLEAAYGIAVAPAGDVLITGFTTSSNDFPLSPNPWQSSYGGGIQDAFVTRFSGSGTLSYSTFIGGAAVDEANAIAISSTNQAWFTGYSVSSDFPVAGAAVQPAGGGTSVDSFVSKLNGDAAPSTEHALLNISTRMRVETGDNALIGGFIVQGTKRKRVIVRAIGPSLTAGGIPASEVLQDPTLELHDGTGAIVASNDNWRTGSQRQAIIDSTLPPADDRESAVVAALNPGAYTAVVRGSGSTTGVGLVELYDIDAASSSKAVNISTRGRVQTGGNVMIGGFILGGATPTTVIVRAIGPSLSPSVAGALQDPALELRNGNGALVDSNDNWVDSPQRQAIINTGVPPSDNRESAVLDTLNPGSYTAIVQGVNATQGVALVEVYKLN